MRRMLERAEESGVELRGQTKTHKTVEGGIIQTGGTKRKIVTSTLIEVVKGGCGGVGFLNLSSASRLFCRSVRCMRMQVLMTSSMGSPSSLRTLRG